MNSVKINCKKILGVVIAALLAATSLFGVLAVLPRSAAHADTAAAVELTKDNAALFLPETYEQYLNLDSPASFDISEEYTVVADGHTLYIYDRAKGEYTKYEHMNYSQPTEHADISKVQIAEIPGAGNDRIFFSDGNSHLYEYQFGVEESQQRKIINNVSVTSFLVDEARDALFTANAAENGNVTLTRYSLDDFKQSKDTYQSQDTCTVRSANSPLLAIDGESLYLVYNNTTVRTCPLNSLSLEKLNLLASTTVTGLQAVECYQGMLYYTVKGQSEGANGLYRSESGTSVRLPITDGGNDGLGALGVYKDELYCIRNKSVLKLTVGENDSVSTTGYEIAAASSSVNRLDGATESVRAGDLLVTADTKNNRISVYDTATGEYQTIACDGVSHVATDGETIAATTNANIYIYEPVWNAESLSFVLQETANIQQTNVVDVVYMYGTFYYVTGDFRYGKIEHGDDGWAETSPTQRMGAIPKAITADLFGDIFVAVQDGRVYRFSEEDFTTKSDLSNPVANIGNDFTSLRAGFDGKLYYLDGDNNLCMHDGTEKQTVATIDGKDFVYTETDKKPVSFALGYEDDEVYFCFGDFLVKSDAGALGLATLESVSKATVDAAAETLSAVKDPRDVLLADFAENAVGVHVDLDAAAGGTDYCLGYARFPEGRRGVLLYTHGAYSLVALYVDHVYSVELFRTADMAGEPFPPEYEDANERPLYLSSACAPYHFPCILGAPARAEVAAPRGTRVTLLAVLRAGGQEAVCGGYDFAYIRYETEARAVSYGYVPYAYLTEVDPLGGDGETFSLGYVKPGVTFTGDDGSQITTTERVSARLYSNGDGTYTAVYTEEGVTYTATVGEKNIEWGESDALRIALIVILSVLAVLIIGGYVYLLPREKKPSKK